MGAKRELPMIQYNISKIQYLWTEGRRGERDVDAHISNSARSVLRVSSSDSSTPKGRHTPAHSPGVIPAAACNSREFQHFASPPREKEATVISLSAAGRQILLMPPWVATLGARHAIAKYVATRWSRVEGLDREQTEHPRRCDACFIVLCKR